MELRCVYVVVIVVALFVVVRCWVCGKLLVVDVVDCDVVCLVVVTTLLVLWTGE